MKADVCHWCGAPKNNRSRNKYCSRKCYWESKIGMEGYWSGKKRPDIAGKKCYRWNGGQRYCECGQPIASRSSKVKMCGECRNRSLSEKTGERHHNWKGGKNKCVDCGKQLSGYKSFRCETCMGNNNRGESNPNWRDGDEKKRLRSSPEYISWRSAVFQRDNYTCRGCGARGVHLEAHHIKSFSEHPDLRFVVDNGITYCIPCHVKNDEFRERFYGEPR